MSLQIGIIGLPNVGKSTLFNALASTNIPAANYPFCTIEPNIGVVPIYDERLFKIAKVIKPEILTGSNIEFLDIAGLVAGASKGEGLGNQFLGQIRQVDAILHVVRSFKNENIVSNYQNIDPLRDAEIVDTELILADIQTLENQLEKASRMLKTGESKYKIEVELLTKALEVLEQGYPLRSTNLPLPTDVFTLTNKPIMYVANVDEDCAQELDDATKEQLSALEKKASQEGAEILFISASLEAELAQLNESEKQLFLNELGLESSGLQRVIQAGLKLLDLITFYTIKGKETRSWIIPKGTLAPQAAGKIHTDMEKGFIRAEVIPADKLIKLGAFNLAREKGLLQIEGRDYPIKDGDVVQFRFNV